LAKYTAAGHVYNVQHQPIAGAELSFTPAALLVQPRLGGGFQAYLGSGGSYDITAQRSDLYGPLPPRQDLSVSANVSGLDFVLPPQDDVVADGGFEAGDLSAWQVTGPLTPTWSSLAHTGDGTVLLGGLGGTSVLSQVLTVPPGLVEPTLSFLVRLDATGDGSTLQVALSGTPISLTQVVDTADWQHVWLPIDPAVSGTLTLAFRLDDVPLVRLDEVSLGSALPGGYWTYLPIGLRQ
jgi:hypothetical protein